MRKMIILICILAMLSFLNLGMSCSQDDHRTYSGYGAGTGNYFPDNNNPNRGNPVTTTINNPPPAV